MDSYGEQYRATIQLAADILKKRLSKEDIDEIQSLSKLGLDFKADEIRIRAKLDTPEAPATPKEAPEASATPAEPSPAPKTPEVAPEADPTSASGDAIDESIAAVKGILEGDRTGGKGARVTRKAKKHFRACLLYTSPSPRDGLLSRMPSSA